MSKETAVGRIAKALIDEYPTAGSLTLAKRLHRDHPEHFPTVEHARTIVRQRRGVNGVKNRRAMTDLLRVKDIEQVLSDKFDLPEPATKNLDPYILPKANDRIIIFGDCHFPYQHNKGIYAAIEYGLHKQVNTIILNGDMVDMYQVSRFTKDGRKPHIEYELEMFYDFLKNLRDTFPNALIIWKFGNHEQRWDTYLKNQAPLLYMVGTESLEDYFPLGALNIMVIKDSRRIVAGDFNILHGHEFGGGTGNVNPARTMSLKAKANTLVSHFHRSSSHKEIDVNGKVSRYYSLGAMCSRQEYMPYGNQDCSFGYIVVIKGTAWFQNREVE